MQFRLLQFNVQAAQPLKDSGNDLIAIRGDAFRAVSVRATTGKRFNKPKKERKYHILAVVRFQKTEGGGVSLDASDLFLIPQTEVAALSNKIVDLGHFRICQDLVDYLFKM